MSERPGQHRVLAGDPLHSLERLLRDARARIDPESLGEQMLPFAVVRPRNGPRREQSNGVVRPPLLDQPLSHSSGACA